MKKTPIYDVNKTYLENAAEGPFFLGDIPKRVWLPENQWIDFLGKKIASPLGVPAGPLLNSQWTNLAADLGFDVVTYKTIRSHQHPAHPLPNIVAVDTNDQLNPKSLPDHLIAQDTVPNRPDIGITNSFGNPSRTEDFLRVDIPKANKHLKPGQVMIVSVFGSNRDGISMTDDFAKTARLAVDCGAELIEANYSCPNIGSQGGNLYNDPEMVGKLSKNIVQAIPDTPLIIKVGIYPSLELMRRAFTAAARAGVRAICGINTISMRVLDQQGIPALGPTRQTCGICGDPIREASLQFIRDARKIIDEEKLDLELIATGGVTHPEHFQQFLDAGAKVTMSATGMMWNPYLATEAHKIFNQEIQYV